MYRCQIPDSGRYWSTTSASLDITKEYPNLRGPDSASDLESLESLDDNDAVLGVTGGDAKG
jgi:hypothetical protein